MFYEENKMKINSYGKINLSLDILSKREDGYHNIDTIMMPIDLYDEIKIEQIKKGFFIKTIGAEIPYEDHLLKKTYDEMRKFLPKEIGFSIELKKNIPIGAGLGGGSSNAGFFIRYLIENFNLEIPENELKEICERLGADIFFFLEDGSARAKGIGADITRISGEHKFPLLIINPGIFISSKEIYDEIEIQPKDQIDQIEEGLSKKDLNLLGKYSYNKMEDVVFQKHPKILDIKNQIAQEGAFLSRMSGAGSTVFGLFLKEEFRDKAFEKFSNKYPFVYKGWTR